MNCVVGDGAIKMLCGMCRRLYEEPRTSIPQTEMVKKNIDCLNVLTFLGLGHENYFY